MAVVRNPVMNSIIVQCMASGRTTQADLSRLLSMDKSLVSYYVGQLIRADMLSIIRVFGREKPLVVADWVRSTLSSTGLMLQ